MSSGYAPGRIAAGFGAAAATYDAGREKLAPGFHQLYEAATRLLPFESDCALRVLDLGAGTGLLSAWILEKFPSAQLVLVDLSGEMLERARERLRGARHEPVFRVLDYAENPVEGRFDAVVSALSIHHLDDERKRRLFGWILQALTPGGVFVNVEQVAGPTAALQQRYRETWLQDVRSAGASEVEIAAALARMADDQCAPLQNQLGWLEQAGFGDVDCWLKIGQFAVYSGHRLSSSE